MPKKLKLLFITSILTFFTFYSFYCNEVDKAKRYSSVTGIPLKNKKGCLNGIDISKENGNINWDTVLFYNPSISFIYLKATFGIETQKPDCTNLNDSICRKKFEDYQVDKANVDYFTKNWNSLRNKNVKIGPYHFYRNIRDVRKQAEYFIKTLRMVEYITNDLPPAIDIENYGNDYSKNSLFTDSLNLFIKILKESLGRSPVLYTNSTLDSVWGEDKEKFKPFCRYNLWLATYSDTNEVPVLTREQIDVWQPNMFTGICENWNFFQYSELGVVRGIDGNVDLDWFRGSLDSLNTFIRTSRK